MKPTLLGDQKPTMPATETDCVVENCATVRNKYHLW